MKSSVEFDSSRVLVVSGDARTREILRQIFAQEGWALPHESSDAESATHWVSSTRWDILLADAAILTAGELSLDQLWDRDPDTIVVALNPSSAVTMSALQDRQVFEFVVVEESPALPNCLRRLRDRCRQRVELDATHDAIDLLVQALESRDRFLQGHSRRVAQYATRLGVLLGLDEDTLEVLDWSARLHDVGKIGVHEDILNKPGPLTADEFELMKRHPALSREIVSPLEYLAPCLPVIYHHHERIDGRGYPDGIAGEEIPLLSRVISVCDSYDAMSHDRPHRTALSADRIEQIFREVAGSQLDSELVDLFLKNKPWLVDLSVDAARKCWTSRA